MYISFEHKLTACVATPELSYSVTAAAHQFQVQVYTLSSLYWWVTTAEAKTSIIHRSIIC